MNDITDISIELRRKLHSVMEEFWLSNKNASKNEIFTINSIVISSLIAHITWSLFKKDIGYEHHFHYIDELCGFAKEQLKDAQLLMKKESNNNEHN